MTMKKIYTYALLACLILTTGATVAFAKTVTLSWNQSTDPNVTGYKVYYKTGSSSTSFNGIGANEGASPIDVGNNTTATLTDLPDGNVYYFAVTAYDASNHESAFSNVVASQWVPALDYPANGDTNVQVPLQFSWSNPPSGSNMTYTLYYGTDPNLNPANAVASQTGSLPPGGRTPLLAGAFCLGLLGLLPSRRKKMKTLFTLAVFGLSLTLASCGSNTPDLSGLTLPINLGPGGTLTLPGTSGTSGSTSAGTGVATGGTGTSSSTGTGQTSSQPFTKVVSSLTDSYFVVTDLQPGTTYYWKVVANDGQTQVESSKGSFTTQAN
jgi:hypothetical protein